MGVILNRIAKPADGIGKNGYVELVDVVKAFDGAPVVNGVNLSIRKNELFALLGSSGSGKSTLLRMMAGLETITSGSILVDGEDLALVPPHRRPVNMMFQSYALFPHMDVARNVGYGLVMEGLPKAQIRDRVHEVLDLVQMRAYAHRKPHQLSGGQQQRVALARSLIKRPKLLLLDEPMSALDKKIRQQTQFELGNILYKVGVTCVLVTHDQEEAMTMADRIAIMSEGSILQVGSPNDVYEYPNCQFAAEFIGSTNLLEGELSEDNADTLDCPDLPAPLRLSAPVMGARGSRMSVSIRPEGIGMSRQRPAMAQNLAQGVIEQFAYMGSYTFFYVRLDSGKLLAVSAGRLALRDMGGAPTYEETVFLDWNSDSCVVLAR